MISAEGNDTIQTDQAANSFKKQDFRKCPTMSQKKLQGTNNPLGLQRYQIDREKLRVLDTALAWDSYDKEFLGHMGKAKVLGFDVEWRPNFLKGQVPNKIAILQLATVTSHCVILQLKQWRTIPLSLRELMADPSVIKVGIDVKKDAEKLQADYGMTVKGMVDLRPLTLKVGFNPEYSTLGLQKLGEHILQLHLGKSKNASTSNWEVSNLTPRQQEYAAIDVLAAVDLFRYIVAKKVLAFKHDPGKSWSDAKNIWEDLIDNDTLGNILHCDICLVDVSSYTTMVTHLNGKQHKKKCVWKDIPVEKTFPPHMLKAIAELQRQQNPNPEPPDCTPQVTCASTPVDEELEDGEIVDLPDTVKTDVQKATQVARYHCDLCNISAMSSVGLHKHMTTAKHQQKLRLSERTDNSEQQSKKQQTIPQPDSTTPPAPPPAKTPNLQSQQDFHIDQALRSIRESTVSLSVNPVDDGAITLCRMSSTSSSSSAVVSSTVEDPTTTVNTKSSVKSLSDEEIRQQRIQSMYCDLCKIDTTDQHAMVTHLSGKKHLKKQRNHGIENSDLFCSVCQCAVTDPFAMKSHLQGKRHHGNLSKGRILPR